MAWHHIDVPKKRSLDWIEKKVHDLLWGGLTPEEIAVKCRKPLKKGWSLSGDAPDSIYDIMSRIREKGHELPVIINKEDEDVKYTDKQKEKVYKLYDEGKTPKEISIKLKLPYKNVWKWCDTYKKQNAQEFTKAELADMEGHPVSTAETSPQEMVISAEEHTEIHQFKDKKEEPASAATDTDSGGKHFGNVSDSIIPENIEPVKGRYFSDDACEAVKDKLHLLYAEIDEVSNRMRRKYEAIEKINASIAEDDAICNGIQFRIDELEADLVIIAGGVIGE